VDEVKNRRPLKTRGAGWANALARGIGKTSLTPNGISVIGILFAAAGAACFLFSDRSQWLLLGAALGIQLRLLMNMLDGLVAVEGGKQSRTGPLYNELPDRIEDALLLVAAGYAAAAPQLGYGVTILAFGTAYIRMTGGALGFAQDFVGPSAKQHRMFVLTVAAIAAAFLPDQPILLYALWLLAAGTALTCIRRTWRIAHLLKNAEP
jgi:phosphatidylglycerophosphate synthase